MTGLYTEIERIIVPSPAPPPGTLFAVEVIVRNLTAVTIYAHVVGDANGAPLDFGSQWVFTHRDASYYLYPLRMPASGGVTITATTRARVGGAWVEDDTATAYIGEGTPAPEDPAGVITCQYMHKGTEGIRAIPATGGVTGIAANGQSFEVYAQFKSTSADDYFVSCNVVVTDPAGVVHTDPPPHRGGISYNEELRFRNFQMPNVNLTGAWTIVIQFLLDNGTVIAQFGPTALFDIPGFAGKLTGLWVVKETEGVVPFSVTTPAIVEANNESFEIKAEWENTSDQNFDARVEIIVRYPDGNVAKTVNSTFYGMTPGQKRDKQLDIVHVVQVGEWAAIIKLVTKAGEVLDEFNGVFMSAAGLTGGITSMWFNQGGHTRAPFATAVEADGQTFEVGVRYVNRSSYSYIAGVKVEIWDPDGLKQPTPPIDFAGIGPDEELTAEYQFGSVDKAGEWIAKLEFVDEDDTLIDEWEGLLFVAIPEVEISDVEILSFGKEIVNQSLPQQETVEPGDVLVVEVSFKYTAPDTLSVSLVTALWIPPGVDYPVVHPIELEQATDQIWTGSVGIPITEDGGLTNDTYHLLAYVDGYEAKDQVDNAVVCTGMPVGVLEGMSSIIGALVMVMMMSMMMNMMGGFTEPFGGVGGIGESAAEYAKRKGEVVSKYPREKGLEAGEWVQKKLL